MSVYYFERKK